MRSTWPLSFRKSTVVASIRVRGGQPFLRGGYGNPTLRDMHQFINVSQKALHIYWQFSAMSHAIHKIVSKRRCQSYFISRRSPHHGISKDSDLCASAHRCPHYAYARLIARVTLQNEIRSATLMIDFLFSFVVSPHTFWYRPPGSHRPWNGACYGSIRNSP